MQGASANISRRFSKIVTVIFQMETTLIANIKLG